MSHITNSNIEAMRLAPNPVRPLVLIPRGLGKRERIHMQSLGIKYSKNETGKDVNALSSRNDSIWSLKIVQNAGASQCPHQDSGEPVREMVDVSIFTQ
jgi:hypothetical protein